MTVETIAGVIESLDEILDDAGRRASRLGYFAALYRRVTVAVARDLEAGRFEDGPRMEAFDVRFARRYLEAYAGYARGGVVTESWRVCFEATTDPVPIVLQHLALGMNAHINLDLGIAAAEIGAPAAFRRDFDRINEILRAMIDEVQADLARVWPLLRPLDWLAGRVEERFAGFSIQVARDHAWRMAEELVALGSAERSERIATVDRFIALFAQQLHRPPIAIRLAQRLIRRGERGSVPETISALR